MDQGDRVRRPLPEIGSGYGGYNQDHEFFGYRQSIYQTATRITYEELGDPDLNLIPQPRILSSADDARAIVLLIPAGEGLDDHEVHDGRG